MQNHPQPEKSATPAVPFYNFNYWISYIFLKNSRLTSLALLFVVALGVFTGLQLKTTGFPSPEIPFAIVQTIYPGASSEQVLKDVTAPLEGAIKDVNGVTRYNSTSNNSFSNITVFIDENEDVDSVRNKIDASVKAVALPEEVEEPRLIVPSISTPSVILAVTGNNLAEVYESYSQVENQLNQVAEISSVEADNELSQAVNVTVKTAELEKYNLQTSDVENVLSTLGESIPAVQNVDLNDQNSGITTSLNEVKFEDLQNLQIPYTNSQPGAQNLNPQANQNAGPGFPIVTTNNGAATGEKAFVSLSEIAEISVSQKYEDSSNPSYYSFYNQKEDRAETLPAVILFIKTVENTDQAKFISTLKTELEDLNAAKYVDGRELSGDFNSENQYIVNAYATNDENQQQVDQVVGGIIGSPISDQWWGNVGFLLGGIQLVVLVMIAFVSWRAAIVGALSIPLSLMFSTIYLWLIGEQLNTLVLFSLVLVLGLVVDPALVILEAIQRKIDAGGKGIDSILAAIKDVGNGIFLASLTNIIVFVPFGILSGIFGQIFAYIPATVIPALVGSYVVPLIFLAWLGGLILKPSKNATDDEEKNLWPVAKWLINFNHKILKGSRWTRLAIILAGLVIPLSIAVLLFTNGSIKQVQFAETDDSTSLILSGNFLPQVPSLQRAEITQALTNKISENENVTGVIASGEGGFNYYVFLTKEDTREIKAKDIASNLDELVKQEYGDLAGDDRSFFDVKVNVISTGAPSDYQVSLNIKEQDLDTLSSSAVAISEKLKTDLCYQDNVVTINENCSSENQMVLKIDDGFTDKDNLIYDLSFNRERLLEAGLTPPGQAPLSFIFNQGIKSQFQLDDAESTAKIDYQNEEVELFVKEDKAQPESINQVLGNLQTSLNLPNVNASEFVEIKETKPQASISRVRGETVGAINIRLKPELQNNQGVASQAGQVVVDYYAENDSERTKALGLKANSIAIFEDGGSADGQKFFIELSLALLLAVVVSYIVLALFFNSLTQPIGILYTIPLALAGVLPALVAFVGGQFGFLEIIGLIILIGIVENVAIFLIDSANQKIREGWDMKRAISYAAGVRFRPVALTSITAIASLAPLAVFSPFYRSIAVVIMFGILASGLISLITTPILFVFFNWSSKKFAAANGINKLLSIPLFPIYWIIWGILDRPKTALEKAEVEKE